MNIRLEDLLQNRSKENISDFAFNIGRMLEGALKVTSNDTVEKNKLLETKILEFSKELDFQILNTVTGDVRNKLTEINIKFIEHFGITKLT